MKTVERLPREFGRFRQIGGALQFAVYEDAGEDEAEALSAISSAIPDLNYRHAEVAGMQAYRQTPLLR